MAQRLLFPILTIALLATSAQAAPLTVTDSWFRALPSKLPAAGYFTLTNSGPSPVALKSAQSSACGTLMLHMTHNMGGMMHMMEVEQVEVPARSTVKFAPGGYHLMCTNPTAALTPGAAVAVTLHFSDGSQSNTTFAVRSATGQ
jgi:copper(I)-binding protein